MMIQRAGFIRLFALREYLVESTKYLVFSI